MSMLLAFAIPVSLCFGASDDSSMRIDENGNAWLALEIQDYVNPPSIQLAYMPYGSSIQTPITISDTNLESEFPVLAVNGPGDGVIVWSSYDTVFDVRALYASTLEAGGEWSDPVRLSQTDENVLAGYRVAVTSEGKIVVSWKSALLEYGYILSARSGNVAGEWHPVSRISVSNS